MLRSFAYAADAAAREVGQRYVEAAPRAAVTAGAWLRLASDAFMSSYEATAAGSPVWTDDAATRQRLLSLHLLAKALYEINYEAGNRPDWIETPIRGVLSILQAEGDGA